jgi:hypothetical protein
VILNVLFDLPFGQNQPPNSVGDWYIRILKNTVKTSDILDESTKCKEIRCCDLS